MNTAGEWQDISTNAMKFDAEGRFIYFDRTDSGWSSCGLPAPVDCGGIPANLGMMAGDKIFSCEGHSRLVMMPDGNLVLYRENQEQSVWETGATLGARSALMHDDGNLALYAKDGRVVWSSNTAGHPGASLTLEDDARLVIKSTDGKPLWSSKDGLLKTSAESEAPGESGPSPGGDATKSASENDGDVVGPDAGAGGCSQSRSRPDGPVPALIGVLFAALGLRRRSHTDR
jgi:hypothetical protein